jgi:predicted small secreted protein
MNDSISEFIFVQIQPAARERSNRKRSRLDSPGGGFIVRPMKYLMILALAAATTGLTSCSVANGLAQSVSRTTGALSRSVSNIGGAVTR